MFHVGLPRPSRAAFRVQTPPNRSRNQRRNRWGIPRTAIVFFPLGGFAPLAACAQPGSGCCSAEWSIWLRRYSRAHICDEGTDRARR